MAVLNSGIYKITNTVNNKIYIGSSINIKQRIVVHLYDLKTNTHSNKYLQRTYNKYGIDSLKFEILEYTDKENLLLREQYYLDTLQSYNSEIGYNLCKIAGSTLGFKHSETTKLKMSESKKGVPKSEDWILQRKARKATESQRLHMSKINKGKRPAAHTLEASRLICSKVVSVFKEGHLIGIFSSITNTAKAMHLDRKTLGQVVRTPNKIYKQFTFKLL